MKLHPGLLVEMNSSGIQVKLQSLHCENYKKGSNDYFLVKEESCQFIGIKL